MNARKFARTDAARTINMSFSGISGGSICFKSDEISIDGSNVVVSAMFTMDQGTYHTLDIWNPTLYDLSMCGFSMTFFVDGKLVANI